MRGRACGDVVARERASAAGASVRPGPAAFPDGAGLPRAGVAAAPWGLVALAGARIDFAPPVAAEREWRVLRPRDDADGTTSLVTRTCWPTRTADCGMRFHSRRSAADTL